MTQKYLGMIIGFDEKTADVRVAQYESGKRTPKENVVNELSRALDISQLALTVPDIDSYYGLMHTLFACEDIYGLRVNNIDGELCLTLNRNNNASFHTMFDMFSVWQQEAQKLKNGEISKEEYDTWRYNYPRIEAERTRERLDALREKKSSE